MNAPAKWMCCANSTRDKDDEDTKVIMQTCSGCLQNTVNFQAPSRPYEKSNTKIPPIIKYPRS